MPTTETFEPWQRQPMANYFAVSTHSVYRNNGKGTQWYDISEQLHSRDFYTDVQCIGDTLIVLSRSHIYTSVYPYDDFQKIELLAPTDYKNRVSLFKTLWKLHSGELFGLPGKLLVDFIGIVTVILCLTGLIIFFSKSP